MTVVNYPESATTPNNTSSSGSSAKKCTPPTPPITDQSRNKKYHLDSEEESKSSTERQKSEIEDMEPINPDTTNTDPKQPSSTFNFDGKLDGFPEEYKAFGRALCEILLKNNESTLNELIMPLKEDIKTLLDEKKDEKSCQQIVEEVHEDHLNLMKRCKKMENENKELRSRLNKLENKMLGNNIIMHGVREETWELDENRKEKVYKAIAPTVDEKDRRKQHQIARSIPIHSTKRIGRYRTGFSRPISICFKKKSHAETLLHSTSYLPEGIYVDKEYSEETEKARKILKPILKLAASKPHYKGKCKIDEDILIIQGKRYTTSNLHTLPEDISMFEATSKSTKNAIGFFGELNPFSNFYKTKFELDNKVCHSTEQYIPEQKAIFFKDAKVAETIMATENPLDCKHLVQTISGYNHDAWKRVAKELCKPGIAAKFGSNLHLSCILKSTGDKTLVEACCDSLWGTGIPLKAKDCLNSQRWTNIGILGEILMEIRDQHLPSDTMEHT